MAEHVGFQAWALCLPDQSSHFSIAKLLICLTSNTARLQKSHPSRQCCKYVHSWLYIDQIHSQCLLSPLFFSCLNHQQKTVQVIKQPFEKWHLFRYYRMQWKQTPKWKWEFIKHFHSFCSTFLFHPVHSIRPSLWEHQMQPSDATEEKQKTIFFSMADKF